VETDVDLYKVFTEIHPPKNGEIALETPPTPLLLDFQWFSQPKRGSLT
jgi:hypothetical protein